MLDEIIKSAKEQVTDRLSSPLMGSFVISWCLWNYKFLVILFSDASVTRTFELIDVISFPDAYSIITKGVIYPALTATAYIFIHPYPSRFIYGFNLKQQRKTNQTKQSITEETLLTLEESRILRAKYIDEKHKTDETIEDLNQEISRLNTELETIKGTTLLPLSDPERMYDKLDSSQLGILRFIDSKGGSALENMLIGQSHEPKVKVEFDIGELQRRKLLNRTYDSARKAYMLAFTHEGRRTFLKNSKNPE